MKNFSKKSLQRVKIFGFIILLTVSFITVFYLSNVIFAWVGPSEHPTDGNIPMEDVCLFIFGEEYYAPCEDCCYLLQGEMVTGIWYNEWYLFMLECPTKISWTQTSSSPEIWRDNITGLYWTASLQTSINWQDSIDYCATLNHGGRTDWRIPTKDEFLQIAPIVHSFPYKSGHGLYENAGSSFTTTNFFWTRNEYENDTTLANGVYLDDGEVEAWAKTTAVSGGGVRCVARD